MKEYILDISRLYMIRECTQHNNYNGKTLDRFAFTNDIPHLASQTNKQCIQSRKSVLNAYSYKTICFIVHFILFNNTKCVIPKMIDATFGIQKAKGSTIN